MQNSYNKDEVTYAGFWVRLAAYLIDSMIVFVGLLIVRLILLGVMSAAKDTALGGNLLFQYNLKDIVLYVMEALYFILFTYYTGTTIGKRLMNLKVVRADGEEKLSLLNVIYRETVGRFLCGVICGIGYILAGIDGEKRGLHDILADTRVIYAKKVKIYKKTEEINLPSERSKDSYEMEQNKVMPWDAPYESINIAESNNNEEKVPDHQEEVERDS
ncbi:MAG: RDD family protein [Lachnospiraceae bacterium]